MLVDFEAGFEDLARGNIATLDWIIVVVDPTTAAVQMAVNMRDTVNQLKAGGKPATAHLEAPELIKWAYKLYREARIQDVLFVLNKVRDEETELYLRHKLAAHGIEPIGVIHDDPAVSLAWLRGEVVGETAVDNLIMTHSTKKPFRLYMQIERIKDAPFLPEEIRVPFSADLLTGVKEIADHSRKRVIPLVSKL